MSIANVGTKKQIEGQLKAFIDFTYEKNNLRDEDSAMNRETCEKEMKELMTAHGLSDAWNPEEFKKVFDLFEEDENDAVTEVPVEGEKPKVVKPSGLDRSEFTKLVKRICQL